MTYSELVNLIKESYDSWTGSEGMEHLPEFEQDKDFYLKGLESVEGIDTGTLTEMLGEEFNDGNWIVSELKDGTIEVEYFCQNTLHDPYLESKTNEKIFAEILKD